MQAAKIFLIDGHALCYRAFYGIAGLANSKGQATNAVYGFVSTLKKILKEHVPSHMAVCFDTGKKTLRQEKFKDYKIQRPSMPEGLIGQLPIIKDVLKAYRIPIFERDGYEADDLIATIVHRLQGSGIQVVIASDDKDMFQLVGKDTLIYSSRHDKVLGLAESQERFGISPTLITDYIGLCGDTSDNIPGVNGIGEVTARNLINQFGTLENLYDHLDEVKQAKVKEKLTAQKEAALFSKTLAVLDSDIPLDLKVDDLKICEPDCKELIRLFNELEFRKFVQEISQDAPASIVYKAQEVSDAAVAQLTAQIKKAKCFSVIAGPKAEDGHTDRFWLSCQGSVMAVGRGEIGRFAMIFADKSITKIAYDSKALRKYLRSCSVDLDGEIFDVLLAGYLLLSGLSAIDIGTLSWHYLKEPVSEDDYAGHAAAVEKLVPAMTTDLKEKNVGKLYHDLEFPLSLVLSKMEEEGVRIDVDALSKLSQHCDGRIKEISTQLYSLAGGEFNLNSPKQLSDVLFVKLKLPVIKKTKTGFSTDEEVLTRLAAKHELPQMILDYRQLSKLKSTYIDALPKLVDTQTNRLHATFNQTGAETGRLSSNNPNLQNIPIRTELGREIRRAFVPFQEEDYLLSADYSQIELRILAHLSQDEHLIKAFQQDEDIHAYTAALVFDVAEDKVDAAMRNAAKRVNFGIIYGISAFGLGKDLGIANAEAQDFIDRYFLRYPKVKTFMDNEIKKAQDLGYVTTLFNRRRYIPEIHSKNIGLRQFAERQAINTPVQGSAADLMKMAMIKISDVIGQKGLRSRMTITVHDELVFNVPADERTMMAGLVRDAMENIWEFLVPIVASVKVGKSWLNMEKI